MKRDLYMCKETFEIRKKDLQTPHWNDAIGQEIHATDIYE